MVNRQSLVATVNDMGNGIYKIGRETGKFVVHILPNATYNELKHHVDYAGEIGRRVHSKKSAFGEPAVWGAIEGSVYTLIYSPHSENLVALAELMIGMAVIRGVHGLYEYNKKHKESKSSSVSQPVDTPSS